MDAQKKKSSSVDANDMAQTADHDSVEVSVQEKLKTPPHYHVLLLNDDYTPMEFVVYVLKHFFNKPAVEAEQIMLKVHHTGRASCGVYPHEVAEMKSRQVMGIARQHQHPLQCVLEKT